MPSTFDQFDAIAEPTESGGSPPDPKDKGLTPPPTSAQSMFSAFDNIAAPKVAPAQQASPFADFDKIAAPVDWIQKYSQQYNVDPDLIRAMTYRESGGNQYYKNGQIVTSPKGALGAMQLMPDTARQLGVDPNDPEQNISGGIKYMSQLLQHFGGDTEKAVAAYHAGQGAVDRAGGIPNTNDGLSTTRDYVNSIMQRYNAHRGYNPEAAMPAAPAAAPVARDQLIAQLADQSLTPDQRADLMVKLTATNRVLQTDKSYKEGEVGDWYSGTGSFYTRALTFMYDISQAPKGILKDWIAKPLASVLPDKIDTDKDMGRWKGEAELYNGFHDLVGVIAEKRKLPERQVYQELMGGDSGARGMAADSLKLVTDFSVNTLSDPVNWPFFFGSGAVRPMLRVGVDAAFAAMMAKGAYDGFKNSAELYDSNRKPWEQSPEFYESLAEPGMNTLFAGLSVHGAREQAGLVGILKRLNEESNTRFGKDWNDLDSKQRSQLTYDMAKVDPSEDLDEAGQKLIHQAVQLGLDPEEFNSTVKARADVMQQRAQEAHDKLLDLFRNNKEEAMDALREGVRPAQQFFGEGGEDIDKEIAGRRQARKENAGRLMDRMIAEAPEKSHTDDALIMDALERTPEEWVQERERQNQLEAWREIQEAQRIQGRPTPMPMADQRGVDVARALALRELDDVAFHKGFDNTQRLVDAIGKYDAAGVKLDPMEERLLQLAHVAGIEPQGIFRHGEPAPKAQPPDPIALLMRTSLEEVRRENNLRKAAQTMDRAAKTANSPEASDAASQAADEARKAAEVARARREELDRQRRQAMKKETEQPLGHPIDGILGNATNITIPAIGKKYAGRYKLVNLKDLTPSHVPQTAPGDWQKNDNAFQPRTDYGHDKEKQQKIIDDSQAATFDLDQIANNNPTHDAGPAMVRSDGLVAGGNGRTMRMLLAYGNGLGEKIHEQIQRVAPVFGIDPGAIAQATANYWPAIVRVFDEDHIDRATMFRVGEELNMASAAGYSEEERAVASSKRISQPQLEMISGILADKGFSIRDFMREENDYVVDLMLKSEMVPQNQRSTFINNDGKLTTAGKNLFEDAVLGKLFNSPDVIRAARNDTPSVLNKIGSSPLAALLRIKARADVWDFTPYLEDMLRLFSNIHSAGQELSDIRVTHRKNGSPVPESDVDLYLHPDRFKFTSGSVFDMRDQPSPITEALAKLFEDKTPEIAKATDEYIKAAEKGDVKDQEGFGFSAPPEPWDIFNTYIGKPNGVHVKMEDWFNNQPPPGQVLRDLGFINVREDKHGTFQVERNGNEGLTVHLKPEEVTTPEATRDLVNKKIDEKVKKGARSLDDIKKSLGIAPPPTAEPEFPDGPQFTEGAYLVPPNIIDRPPHAVVEPSKADFTPVPGLKDQDGPTVFVGRHGETNLNGESGASAERIRGWKDVPLNEQGRADAKRLAEMLVGKGITHVIASDLHRTQETGRIIADRLGVPFKTDQRARPWNLGDLTGEPVATAIKDLVRYQNNPGEKVPNGEAYNDFYARFANLLQEVTDDATRNKTVPMILGHSRNMLATPHIISDGKVDIAAKGGPRPGSAIMIRAGEDGKFALADKFETEGEETRGSKPVTSEKAERSEKSEKPEEQALPGETPATEGEKPKSQMVQDVEESITAGRSDATTIDWVNGEEDPRRAIAASRKEFEDAGWKWDEKEGQLEKDGWYVWYRSQGDLSSPVLQWDRLKPPPDADVLLRTELTAGEINRAKDAGRSVADTEEHLLAIRQQLDKFPNTTPEQREAVLALWRMNAEHNGMTLAQWVKAYIKGIDTETTVDKLSPNRLYQDLPTDIEDAIRAGGGTPRGRTVYKNFDLAYFDDPKTRSTLALPVNEVSEKAVRERITEHRKKGAEPLFQDNEDSLFKHDWQMLDAMADQALQRQDVVRMMKDDIRAHPHLGFDPDAASVRWYVRVILDKYIRGDEQGFSPRTVEAVLNSIAPHDLAKYQDMKREELAQGEIDALRGQLFEVQKKLKQSGFMTDDHFYLSYRQKQIREQLEELNVNPDEPDDQPERMDPQDFLFQHTTGLAPTFYNKSEKIVSEKMQGPMASKDVMAMLRNGGVKKDEIKWTGLDDFLKDHAVVSPQQMQDFIAGNSLQVTDIVKGGKKYLLDDQGRTIPDGAGGLVENKDATKYGDRPELQTPGGTNYRELLLTLPAKDEVAAGPRGWNDPHNPNSAAGDVNFRGGHYGDQHLNVLAHVRLNDRIAPDGKKVLFLEEIQSDWHQKGRRQGYQVPLMPTEHERMMQLGGKGQLTDAEFSEHEALTMRDAGALLGRVPDAPFKNTWHELALKRMLRYAAENDYDRVAWTTGEQQTDRYDLSKHLKEVTYEPQGDDRYAITAKDHRGKTIELGVKSAAELPDVVGKDLADKIISGYGNPAHASLPNTKVLSGLDLKIGGQGMAGFYDKIVSDFLKKYTKKWGATVEERPFGPDRYGVVENGVGNFYVIGPDQRPVTRATKSQEAANFKLKEILDKDKVHSIDVTPAMKDAVMHEGQPLFQGQKKGAVQFMDDGAAMIHGFQSGDVSTLVHETAHIFRRTMKPEETRMAEDWLGIENGEWLRSHEEAFARGFEKYLYEGKAPNPDMKKIFAQFKEWLKGIYQRIVGSPLNDVRLTDTARKVYANILGANDPRVEAAVRKKAIKESAKAIPEPPPIEQEKEPETKQLKPPPEPAPLKPPPIEMLPATSQALRELSEKAGVEYKPEKAVLVDKAQADDLAARIREQMGMGAGPALPGMAGHIEANRESAAGLQGEELSKQLIQPPNDISRASGNLERGSDLFGRGESIGQSGLFKPPDDTNKLFQEQPDDETPNLLFAEDSGLPPKVFGDMVKLGIHHFEASDRSYTGWANGMVKTLGPWVTPYLQRIFEEMPATAQRMANDAGRRLDMSQDDRVKAFRAAKMFAQAAKILTEANQKKEIPRIIIPRGVDADETDVQSPGRIQEGRLPTAGRQPSDIQRTGPDAAPGQQESERPQRQPRAGSGDVSTKGVERAGDKPVTSGTTASPARADTTSKRKTVDGSDVSGGQGRGEKTPKGASGRDVPKEPAVPKAATAPTGALRHVPEARLDKPIRQRGTPVYKDDEWTAMARHYNIPENAPVPFVRLSDETRDALLPGQPEITEIMLSGLMQHDAFVGAMATGTGKTFMGSAIIKELQPEHTLILSKSQNLLGPMSERGSWSQVGMDHFGVEIKPLPKDFQNDTLEPGHYTATYARARDIKDLLARQKWDLVIADEAGEARRWYDSSQGEMLKALGNSAGTDKILYLSATPFHNALELGYLERLGLWRDEGFENWAKQFGVTVSYDKDGNPSYSGGHAPRKLMKLREQLIERGQFINLDRNMDGFSAHFGIVPLTDVQKMEIKNAVKAFAMAENYFAGERPGLVRPTRAVMSTYLKNYVERARLPQAIELGKKLEQQGWHPIYFTENKAERLDVYDFMKNNIEDDAILARVRQLLPQFESTDQALQKAFGNKLANFSGPDSQERRAELKAFRNGEKTHMYASYAAGGIGVGMHDTAGDAPRAPIYIGLPWSGVMFDQATGRPWRYGTRSDVAAYFLTSDLQHEVNLVIDKIAPRLESLKALVSGVKEDPIVKSMRTINGAIEYLLGNEQTADVADFGRTIDAPITHWDQLPVRSAKEAMGPGKGLKLPEPYKRKPPNVLGQDFSEPPPSLPDSIDEAGQQAIAVAEDARHSAAAEEGLTGQGDHPDHLDWAERELRAAAGMPIAEGSQGPKPPDDIMGAAQIGPAGENVPPPKDIGFPSIAVSSMERGMPDTIAKLISRPETAVRTWVAYAHTAPYTIGKFEEGRPLAERLTKAEREKRQETADMLHTVLHEKLPEFKIKEGSTEDSQVYEALRKSQNPARELAGVVSEVTEKPYPANVLDAAQFLRDKIYDPLWERAHEVRPDFKYRKQYATIIQRLRGLDWGHPLLKGMLPQDVQQYMSLPIRRAIARNPFSPYLLPRDKNENLNFGIHETMRAYIPSLLKVIHDTPAVRDGLLMVSEVDKAEQPLLREFMERYLRHYAGVPGEYKETQSVMFRMTRSIVNANYNALLEMNPTFLGLRMMHVIQNTLPDLGPKYVMNGMTSFATADGRELLARSGVLNDMPPIKSKALQIGREILHSLSWQTEFMNRGISYLGALERAKDIGMLGDPSKVGPLSMDRLRELAADGVDVEKALDYAYDTVARNQFMYTPAYVQFQLRDHPLALQFKAWPIRTVELISNIIQNARQDRKKASLLIGLLAAEGAFGYNFLHLAVPPLVTLGAETANTLNKVLHGRATEAEIEKLFKDLAINFIPGAGYVLRKLTAKDKKQHLQE